MDVTNTSKMVCEIIRESFDEKNAIDGDDGKKKAVAEHAQSIRAVFDGLRIERVDPFAASVLGMMASRANVTQAEIDSAERVYGHTYPQSMLIRDIATKNGLKYQDGASGTIARLDASETAAIDSLTSCADADKAETAFLAAFNGTN